MDIVHRRTIEEKCIEEIGFRLDFDYNKPIMEYQPIACTKNPPYSEFWMPVLEL
ncbi:hypothetical protein D3C81_1825200 [compost metagenome]